MPSATPPATVGAAGCGAALLVPRSPATVPTATSVCAACAPQWPLASTSSSAGAGPSAITSGPTPFVAVAQSCEEKILTGLGNSLASDEKVSEPHAASSGDNNSKDMTGKRIT